MVKTCAFCEKTDKMCYTSNPPKRKCTITGKFHEYDHICDVPITNADRIRAMSDEELAEFLGRVTVPCDYCQLARVMGACTEALCDDAMKNWLKRPAEGADNG